MLYKLRKCGESQTGCVANIITIPPYVAQNFSNTYFRIYQWGHRIILESGAKPE